MWAWTKTCPRCLWYEKPNKQYCCVQKKTTNVPQQIFMSIFFLWFLCWFIPIFSKCTSNIMIWSAKLSLHLCVTLLCMRFKWVMVQRSKHVDALLSPDAISLPHVPSSVAFFLRNSWRLKVAAWIGWTSSIYMEESTVVQLLLELWTSAFKNMTPRLPCFSSLSIRFHPLTFRHHSCRWIHPVIQKEKN